jgi:hypothetical protein
VGKLTDLQTLRLQALCNDKTEYLTIDPETTAALASALAALPHLEELDMRRNIFSAEAATALAGTLTRLTQLTELTMGRTWDVKGNSLACPEAVAALIAPLTALTSLTKLETYEGHAVPATIETLASALGRMPALTWLDAGRYGNSCGPAGRRRWPQRCGTLPCSRRCV